MARGKKRKQDETDAITIHHPPRKERRTTHVEKEEEEDSEEDGERSTPAHDEPTKTIAERFNTFGYILSEIISTSTTAEIGKSVGDAKANFIAAIKTMHSDGLIPWLDDHLEERRQREAERRSARATGTAAPSNDRHPHPLPPLSQPRPPLPSSSSPSPPNVKWPPPLPPIHNPHLRLQAFTHKSFIKGESAGLPGTEQQHYERLEFLGDSYLQSIASHILYSRFPLLREGPLSDMRSQLVANRPLSTYATLYNFHKQIREAKGQSNAAPVPLETNRHGLLKDAGLNKTLADCFEAYLAAVVLDSSQGTRIVREWLEALFEPKLKEMELQRLSIGPVDKMAKQTLNTMVGGNRAVVEYEWTGGLGGNKGGYWISVFLTGWGFEKREIGSGWGTNKGEAALRAAMNCLANREFCEEMSATKARLLGPRMPAPPSTPFGFTPGVPGPASSSSSVGTLPGNGNGNGNG